MKIAILVVVVVIIIIKHGNKGSERVGGVLFIWGVW